MAGKKFDMLVLDFHKHSKTLLCISNGLFITKFDFVSNLSLRKFIFVFFIHLRSLDEFQARFEAALVQWK